MEQKIYTVIVGTGSYIPPRRVLNEAFMNNEFYDANGNKIELPKFILPMTISKLGNSSVATVPTLLNLLLTGKMDNHRLLPGQIAVFTSVGAGMNINSVIYKVPYI